MRAPRRRIVDVAVFAMMAPRRRCPACGRLLAVYPGASRHHVLPSGQGGDDVLANLMWLCGHGTIGCHGDWHARRGEAAARIRGYLEAERPDTLAYLKERLPELGRRYDGWMARNYPAADATRKKGVDGPGPRG